jgi:hypothetical protein
MINLRALEFPAGEEGARKLFQSLIADLVALKNKNAKEIRPSPGDWGIDVLVGDFTSGSTLIWQSKYFPTGIGKSQRDQIEDSFKKLVEKSKEKGFKVDGWCLCLPCDLSAEETMWWEGWSRKKNAETGITTQLMHHLDIEQLLLTQEADSIRQSYKLENDSIQSYRERVIQELPEEKASEYENSLFIKKLVFAGITENMSARSQFFNAELVQREIHDKGDELEIAELKGLYEKIHSMWESRFNEALQSNDPKTETKRVYTDMLRSIEQTHKGILNSPRIAASFLHKQGFMQQLADVCNVGWTPDFHILDTES